VKVGDLVRWLYPEALDYGIILQLGTGYFAGDVFVEWQRHPEHSGYYPTSHELLEVVSEAR